MWPRRPCWACLGSIWGGFERIFGSFLNYIGTWAENQKTLKNLRFLKVFNVLESLDGIVEASWGGFGRCGLEVE